MRDAGGDSGSAVTPITTPNYDALQIRPRSTSSFETSHIAWTTPASRTSVPASSSPICREQPAASAAELAASRRSTLAPLNHVLRDPAGAVCSGSRHHSTADQPWLVEVVGGGVFCRQPACFCKREATDRAPAGSTLAGRGKPNLPGEFLFRSFDGTARASGEAESPGPRKSPAPRGKRP